MSLHLRERRRGSEKHTLVGSAWVKDTAKGQVVSINLRPGISVSGELVLFEANDDN